MKEIFKKNNSSQIILVCAFFIYLCFSLYKIDTLPGEWYIDITIVHSYVMQILHGTWPHLFLTSEGPFYPYITAPFVALMGESYLTYKIISIATGFLGIWGIYLFTKQVSSVKIGSLAALVTSLSFMYIIWSRLGNFNIVVPVLTAFMGYFLLKYIHVKKNRYLVVGIILASCGLLTYPELFLMPIVLLTILGYGLFSTTENKKQAWKILVSACIGFIPVVTLFMYIVTHDVTNFTNGHIGSKVIKKDMSLPQAVGKFGHNLLKTAGMLHIQGDIVFRVNVSKSPHLDLYSGVFFLIGLLYVLMRKRDSAFYILFPWVVFILPGASPGLPDIDMPNTARTLGTLPMTYMLVAFGIWAVYTYFKKRLTKNIAIALVCFSFFVIAALNVNAYFIAYANGLPYHNTPFGKIIASQIDRLPPETTIYVTACCWGQWSQPELASIYYVVKNKAVQPYFRKAYDLTDCQTIKGKHLYMIFNPDDHVKIDAFHSCFPQGTITVHKANGFNVFTSLYVKNLKL